MAKYGRHWPTLWVSNLAGPVSHWTGEQSVAAVSPINLRLINALGCLSRMLSPILTYVTTVATLVTNLAQRSGRQPVTPAGGAGAAPAGQGSSPWPSGGFGKTSGRHYDRSAAMSAGLGQAGRVTPVSYPRPRKNVLELSGGVRSLPQVPWWDADRRAAPAGAATASRWMRTEGYASIGVPPS